MSNEKPEDKWVVADRVSRQITNLLNEALSQPNSSLMQVMLGVMLPLSSVLDQIKAASLPLPELIITLDLAVRRVIVGAIAAINPDQEVDREPDP